MLGGMDIEDAIEECWKYFEGEMTPSMTGFIK